MGKSLVRLSVVISLQLGQEPPLASCPPLAPAFAPPNKQIARTRVPRKLKKQDDDDSVYFP